MSEPASDGGTASEAGATAAALDERARLVAMPLTRRRVLLPTRNRASARAGMALASASRPGVVRAHVALERAVMALGPRLLPRVATPLWPGWLGDEERRALAEALCAAVGPFDAVAVRHPLGEGRRRVLLLLIREGRAVGFVKVRTDRASVQAEVAALGRVAGGEGAPVQVPDLLAKGETGGLHWLVTSALPPGCHTPADEPGPGLEAWLAERLGPLLERSTAPAHWRPSHGDLTPWNLRRSGSSTWLLDWEAVCLAPPGADRAYFRATAAAVLGAPAGPASPETVSFWRERVAARGMMDRALNERLLAILAAMAPATGSS